MPELLESYNFPPIAEKVQLEFPFIEQLRVNDIFQEEELHSGQCKKLLWFVCGNIRDVEQEHYWIQDLPVEEEQWEEGKLISCPEH